MNRALFIFSLVAAMLPSLSVLDDEQPGNPPTTHAGSIGDGNSLLS